MRNSIRSIFLLFIATFAVGQQQIIPDDFSADQARLFHRITEAVSTPCCQNGIPVAYHASGQALQVQAAVAENIRAELSESAIMEKLANMRFGPEQDMAIIFTIPDKNLLGTLFWYMGVGLVILLMGLMAFMLRYSGKTSESDDALIEKYRSHIRAQVEGLKR